MQKKLIAVAVAGLMSGAAFAQSNVTIYGVADATFDMIKQDDSTVANANDVRYNRVSTNSSHIGFKGAETIGGLTAVFQYESSVNFDATGGTLAARDSFVGLAGGFGTVVLGNLTGPTRAFGSAVDVNAGATGIGANTALIGKLGNLLRGTLNTATVSGAATAQVNASTATRSSTQASAYDNRFANAIAYVSPTFGGVTAIVGYVPNEGKIDSTGAGTKTDPSAYDLGLKYAAGPVLVGLAYAHVKLNNDADTITKNIRLVGSFDFGMGTVRVLAEQGKAEALGLDVKQNVYGIGATFNVGSGKIIGQYYTAAKVKGDAGLGAGDDTGAKLFTVGYEHSLSKRTMVKAVYSKLANEDAAAYDYGVNGVGTTAIGAGADLNGLSIGLRHSF